MSKLIKYDTTMVESDAMRYLAAHNFIETLKKCGKQISSQQYKTLRGQALAGDIKGAEKGLAKLMGWRTK